MNRREFMKTAVAAVAGASVGGTGAVAALMMDGAPVRLTYTQPRFKAGEPIKAGVKVYIAADGRAHEAWIKRGLMSMAQFRKQVGAERAALLVMEQHPEMLRFIATDRAIC